MPTNSVESKHVHAIVDQYRTILNDVLESGTRLLEELKASTVDTESAPSVESAAQLFYEQLMVVKSVLDIQPPSTDEQPQPKDTEAALRRTWDEWLIAERVKIVVACIGPTTPQHTAIVSNGSFDSLPEEIRTKMEAAVACGVDPTPITLFLALTTLKSE